MIAINRLAYWNGRMSRIHRIPLAEAVKVTRHNRNHPPDSDRQMPAKQIEPETINMSITTKTIVVPWDFSDRSRQALQRAIEVAETPDQIEVVYVTPYPMVAEFGFVGGVYCDPSLPDDQEEKLRKELAEEGYPDIKSTILFGDPGSQIVDLARNRNAGLIVISSHGRHGFDRVLLGSVAERVVRLAHCPVLVLRSHNTTADR